VRRRGAAEAEGQEPAAASGKGLQGRGFPSRGGLYAERAVQLLQDFYIAGNPNGGFDQLAPGCAASRPTLQAMPAPACCWTVVTVDVLAIAQHAAHWLDARRDAPRVWADGTCSVVSCHAWPLVCISYHAAQSVLPRYMLALRDHATCICGRNYDPVPP
jgi:hypothetical protein